MLLVDVYPFVWAFVLSFQGLVQGRPLETFVGLENYREVIHSSRSWRSLWITLKWTAGSVAGQLVLGTALALLLHSLRFGQRLFAALLLLPWATPLVVAALTWRWLLNAEFGIVNAVLPLARLGFSASHDWLGEPSSALASVVLAHVWKYYGFVLLIVLARLKTIPQELEEAARVDGAGPWAKFVHITLPQLWDVISVTVLLMLIWTFNTFDMVFLMTQGSQATQVLSVEVYRHFYGSFNFGLAAATSVLMFLLLLGFAIQYARRIRW